MAGKPKRNAVEMPSPKAATSVETVFDADSWEARVARARLQRDKVFAAREASVETARRKGSEGPGAPKTTGKPDGSVLSLEKVLETRNLKERLELAQERHAQVNRKASGNTHDPMPAGSHRSSEAFKKVVLQALSDDGVTAETSPEDEGDLQSVLAFWRAKDTARIEPAETERSGKKGLLLISGLAGAAAVTVAGFFLFGSFGLLPRIDAPVSDLNSATVATSPQPETPELNTGPIVASPAVATVAPPAPEFVISEPVAQPLGSAESDQPLSVASAVPPQNIGFQPPALGLPETAFDGAGIFELFAPDQELPVSFAPAKPDYLGGVAQAVNLAGVQGPTFGPVNISTEITGSPPKIRWGAFEAVSGGMQISRSALPAQGVAPSALIVPAIGNPGFASPRPIGAVVHTPEIIAVVAPLQPGGLPNIGGSAGVVGEFSQIYPASLGSPDLGSPGLPSTGELPAPYVNALLGSIPVARPTQQVALGLPAHSIRVFAPTNVADSVSGPVMGKLDDAGFTVASFRPVGISISSDNVRYYHSSDAKTAAVLANLVSAKARDFTSFSPRPPRGVVELWLAGSAPRSTTRTAKRAATGSTSTDPALQALRDRLVQRMQRGDHLGGG